MIQMLGLENPAETKLAQNIQGATHRNIGHKFVQLLYVLRGGKVVEGTDYRDLVGSITMKNIYQLRFRLLVPVQHL